MDKLKLFEFIQGEDRDSNVLDQLKRHVDQGRNLEWFQDAIPRLIPGFDDVQSWLGDARDLLWGPAQRSEHEKNTARMEKLLQPSPRLCVDRYKLRQHWPVCVEALRPMTKEMLAAANSVYHVVAGQDCLTEDRNRAGFTSETDKKHHAFVAIRMVLQDKVLMPVISDMEQGQRSLSEELEHMEDEIHDLVKRLSHVDMEDDQRATNEIERRAAENRRDYCTEEQRESKALLEALTRFQDKLVAEKDERDQYRESKRDMQFAQLDAGDVESTVAAELRDSSALEYVNGEE